MSIAVQDLVKDERVDEVVIGDIDLEQARIVADYLDSPKISVRKVDVKDRSGLVEALRGSDACLNATVYYTNLPVMEACLSAGTHYTDLGGLFHTTRKQLELHPRLPRAGFERCARYGFRSRDTQRAGPICRRALGRDRQHSNLRRHQAAGF